MSNGKKDSKKPQGEHKRIGDVVPEGHVNPSRLDIGEIVDKDVTFIAVEDRTDGRGVRTAVIATIDDKGVEKKIYITKVRVMDKLIAARMELPLKGKIVKGDRYYDIS